MCKDVVFKRIPIILASESTHQDRNMEHMAEVHIDIRKLLQFLAGQQVNPTKALCSECASLLFFIFFHILNTLVNSNLTDCV